MARKTVQKNKDGAPWAAIDPSLGPALRAILPGVVEEVLDAVRGVPAYAAPLEGAFGRTVRIGVDQALGGFVELIESGAGARVPGRDVYVALGRGEVRQGRTLDALLAAYRAGAQVAWRRFAEAATEAGAPPEALIHLAEAVFAFIDELSAASAEGHAEAAALAAGRRQDRRRVLLELLLQDTPVADDALAEAAQEAGWRVPKRVSVVVFEHAEPLRLTSRLPADALIGGDDGEGRAVIPDPTAPGRSEELKRAFAGVRAAIGPPVDPTEASHSKARAALALPLAGEQEIIEADGRLLDLLLKTDERLASDLATRALAPLEALPRNSERRLTDTLQAWLDHQGEARPAAEQLHVHVQTVRYRVAKLRELFGDRLDDPTARIELALALRARDLP